MTEKDLATETVLADRLAERNRQVLELSQRCNALEQELTTTRNERDSLLERIRELEGATVATSGQCAHSVSTGPN